MSERGSAPLELALGLGLLLLPMAMTLLAFVPVLHRRSLAGELANQTAALLAIGRPVDEVLALLEEDASFAGIPSGEIGVGLCVSAGAPGRVVGSCEVRPGTVVSVTVVVPGPSIPVPFGIVGAGPVSATNVRLVDRHRSLP